MAIILNLYSNYELDEVGKSCSIGIAGITGHYANQSNWIRYSFNQRHGDVFFVTISKSNSEGIELSGGSPIYNYQFDAQIPFIDIIPTDTRSNTTQTPVYNPFLIGKDETSACAMELFCSERSDTAAPNRSFTVRLVYYTQTPQTGARQTWLYNYNSFHPERSISIPKDSQFGEIRIFKLNIWETNYYAIFAGINAAGETSPTNNTMAFLIPVEYFKDREIKPYVGPVSKDSAAAFTPTTPKRDSIGSRDLTGKKNPYGFNTGNGLKLLVLTAAQQADIVKQIYTGLSGNDLNALGQIVSGVVGGNAHRNAEELRAMIDAVLCCHIVPVITAGYAGASVPLYTIAGYQLYNTARAVPAVTDQIVTYTTPRVYIAPIVNNFLTYAPYCTVSLSVPFVGDIPVDPSILFESSLYFAFYLDLYTGTLSVDVHAVADDGRDFIYTTRQTNCAVDIPIMGTGATGNPLQKIASAAGNVASSGVSGAPAAVFNIASAYNDMTHAVPVGRAGAANIAPYFSQRHCYLVIEYPESANPDNYFDLNGGVAELSGTVGSFSGWTEFSAVDLSAVSGATDAEKREILRQLQGGVFI